MAFHLNDTSTYAATKLRNERLAAQAKKIRAGLLVLVPDEFTSSQLAKASGLSCPTTSTRLQQMLRHNEVVKAHPSHSPATYRKVNP